MKTRTLLLLALGCGLAIMVAGAALFVRLSRQEDVAPASAIGQPATVGELALVVSSATESDGRLTVSVQAQGVADDITSHFRLIASGRAVEPAPNPCLSRRDRSVQCVLVFDVSASDGTSRVLFVERGDQQARWVLAD